MLVQLLSYSEEKYWSLNLLFVHYPKCKITRIDKYFLHLHYIRQFRSVFWHHFKEVWWIKVDWKLLVSHIEIIFATFLKSSSLVSIFPEHILLLHTYSEKNWKVSFDRSQNLNPVCTVLLAPFMVISWES